MLNAKPSINGNTEGDFQSAYVALMEAMEAVDGAKRALSENVLNGRNYQHNESPDDALINDKREAHAQLLKARGILGTLASDVSDAIGY